MHYIWTSHSVSSQSLNCDQHPHTYTQVPQALCYPKPQGFKNVAHTTSPGPGDEVTCLLPLMLSGPRNDGVVLTLQSAKRMDCVAISVLLISSAGHILLHCRSESWAKRRRHSRLLVDMVIKCNVSPGD